MDEVIEFDMPEIDWRPGPVLAPQPLDEAIQTYNRLLPELLATHRGQFVAILGDRVVGTGIDLFAVLKQAYAEYGYRPILCRLVTDQPRRVARIPSVRVWRR
jgi:hypothetical protein